LTEPTHAGHLIAFREVGVESRPPEGCLPGEFLPECAPSLAVVVRHRACWLDAEDTCDSIPISSRERVESFAGLDVDGRRIVWAQATDTEKASVRTCEFDPISRTCPEERLSGAIARQDAPALDGSRIVWRDARAGPIAIFSYALPEIRGRATFEARAGHAFKVGLRARRGTSPGLTYAVEAIDGLDPSRAKARVVDPEHPGGRVELHGWLPHDVDGPIRWRVRAFGEGALSSSWPITLEVVRGTSDAGRKSRARTLAPKRSGHARGRGSTPGR